MKSYLLLVYFAFIFAAPTTYGNIFHRNGIWTKTNAGGDVPHPRSRPVFIRGPDSTVLMFGGQYDNENQTFINFNDLHIYDSHENKWKELHPIGALPPARVFASGFRSGFDSFVIFGGGSFNNGPSNIQFFNDFWEYKFSQNSWTRIIPQGDSLPAGGLLGPDCVQKGNKIYIFGGVSTNFVDQNQMYLYEIVQNRLTKLNINGPKPNGRHHPVLIEGTDPNSFIIYFGDRITGGVESDMWLFNTQTLTYSQITPVNPPAPRQYLVGTNFGNKWYGYGGDVPSGAIQTSNTTGGTFEFDYHTKVWTELDPSGPSPPTLKRHRVASPFIFRKKMVMFGGFSQNEETNDSQIYLDDVWIFTAPLF